jgi:CheY-like chemotaxis protein
LNELAGEELVRAHHGSIAREQRLEIEDALKAGKLPALVATSSLELGIDMGAIDLVIQVESPTSVASGLQRIGRAGHRVDEPSRGRLFPKSRGDLVVAAVDDPRLSSQWERFLEGSRYHLATARTLDEARPLIFEKRPAAVIIGPFLGGATTRPLLADLRKEPSTRELPVLGLARSSHDARLLSLRADLIVERLDERHELLEALARAVAPPRRVLLIAQDSRDELRAQLAEPRLELLEARDAAEGVRRAREEHPRTVVVDAAAPGFAEEALDLLRDDPDTRGLPVLVRAPRELDPDEERRLSKGGARVVPVQRMLRDEAARALRAAVWEVEASHG